MDPKHHTAETPETTSEDQDGETSPPDPAAELEEIKDKWMRALAEVENARKRANAARLDGREHGLAVAVEALVPAFDAVTVAIETARKSPEADTPALASYVEGLCNIKTAFEAGLKVLGVTTITPEGTAFDPERHEALQAQETDKVEPGHVLALHRPGLALGKRLIRPAHVTVSTAPGKASGD
ncbi:nucleotide exchange factor GrpE [uncultured Roseovarius sp.]|uniref:nucleotide exchange factor GrpE n=1 Tax=Roseovarius sp. TaxID=1486281 RepID=UPI0025F4DF25|nr:nucleotide exchange factor GrpE [uncultured Roseovarius sp.]